MTTDTPVITISGPQGCGKSNLLDTIAFDLRHRGFTVLEEHEGPIPAGEGMVVVQTEQTPMRELYQTIESTLKMGITRAVAACHGASVRAGWWNDLETGESLKGKRNVGELLCLIHSEISEAMEGHRKGLMDDKLHLRPMIEVELADALIRIFDLAGALELDVGGALVEKLAYNANRADHKPENRRAAGGKRY